MSTCGLICRTSTPPTSTTPDAASQKRGIRLAAVVLPPPEGPTSATVCPGSAVKEDMGEGGDFRTVIGKADVPERNLVAVRRLRVRGYRRVGASITGAMRLSAAPASIIPLEANMMRASAVEMMAENTA